MSGQAGDLVCTVHGFTFENINASRDTPGPDFEFGSVEVCAIAAFLIQSLNLVPFSRDVVPLLWGFKYHGLDVESK